MIGVAYEKSPRRTQAMVEHDVPLLARRSRCFVRTLETLKAAIKVLWVLTTALDKPSTAIAYTDPKGIYP